MSLGMKHMTGEVEVELWVVTVIEIMLSISLWGLGFRPITPARNMISTFCAKTGHELRRGTKRAKTYSIQQVGQTPLHRTTSPR